jgi:ribosomal protein L30/L7E
MERKTDLELGVKSEFALQAQAPYYLLTQVRKPFLARPRIRGILRGLALGQMGSQVIVPNAAPLIAAITAVSGCLLVRPMRNPSERPTVGILAGWEDLPGKLVYWSSDWDSEFIEVEELPNSTSLVQAVKNIGRQMRPELTDAELEAGAEVIASDITGDEKLVEPIEDSEIRNSQTKVREAIKLVRSNSVGPDSPEAC